MAAGSREFDIFVRNAQDEYITTVALQSQRRGGSSWTPPPSVTDALSSQCVVEDYTRDASVLDTSEKDVGAVAMIAVKNADKLKSFRSYLAGRRKAGVVKLPGGGRFFLLPKNADPQLVPGESIVGLIQAGGGVADHRAASVPPPPPPPPPPTPPPPPSGSKREGGSDSSGGRADGGKDKELPMGGFLGSLMGSIDQTHKRVANTAAAVDRANRAQEQAIRQQVSNFEVEVREKIAAFSTDPAAISHTFPHAEKSLRSIQHSLAEECDGITTRTEGELDDRRVVLYKLGFEPPEEEVQVDRQVHIGSARTMGPSSSSMSAAPMPPLDCGGAGAGSGNDGAGDLVRIGTIIKDRRTVQDIEEDSRKRRRHGY